jgi:uncharacterized protein (UPF0303 family)
MSAQDDIKIIIGQEQGLVFAEFNEAVAFEIGSALRERALREHLGIVADVRTWDRPLFYMALPGTTGDNPNWVRRKTNVVQRMMKSSYRVVLEKNFEGDAFPPMRGLDNMDFVLAGGGFPVRVKGAGIIGAITVSGLHQRDDHSIVVDAICDHLGLDRKAFALPRLADAR